MSLADTSLWVVVLDPPRSGTSFDHAVVRSDGLTCLCVEFVVVVSRAMDCSLKKHRSAASHSSFCFSRTASARRSNGAGFAKLVSTLGINALSKSQVS